MRGRPATSPPARSASCSTTLAERRADWFSIADRDFVAASEKAFQDDVTAKKTEAEQRQRERDEAQARQIEDANKLALAARNVAASEQRAS